MKPLSPRIRKVTKHTIKDNRVHFFSTNNIQRDEHCYLCGNYITTYNTLTENDNWGPCLIDAAYQQHWDSDVVLGNTIYHLCSQECKDVFVLTPPV